MSTLEVLYDKQRNIPVEFLYKQFTYDPLSGELQLNPKTPEDFSGGNKKSKATKWNRQFAGHVISPGADGYSRTNIRGVIMLVHQIAWAMHYGEWAFSMLDHIDGDGTNNRINNLRKADYSMNSRNMKLNSSNTSGVCGLSVNEGKNRISFTVTIQEDGISYPKTFSDFFEAVCYRKSYEKENGYTERHGMVTPEEQSVADILLNLDYSKFEMQVLEEGEPNFKFEYAFESKTDRTSFYRTISHSVD